MEQSLQYARSVTSVDASAHMSGGTFATPISFHWTRYANPTRSTSSDYSPNIAAFIANFKHPSFSHNTS